MITGFADRGTEDIYHGITSKAAHDRLQKELWSIARRKLDMLNRSINLMDLRVPPGNRLEALRINDQYRLVFKFEAGNASQVRITDYH